MLTAEEHLAWAVFAACQDGIVVTARLSLNLVCMPKPYILPSVHILHHGTIGFSSSYLFTCEQVSVCFSSFVLALKLKLPYFQFTILSSSSVSQHTASWCLLSVYLETWLTPTHFTSHCLCELLEDTPWSWILGAVHHISQWMLLREEDSCVLLSLSFLPGLCGYFSDR